MQFLSQFTALVLTGVVASLFMPGPWVTSGADAARAFPAPEVVELRSAKTKTVREPDGTLKTTLSEQSLHYLDEEENWKEIDASFKASSEQGREWESGDNRFSVALADRSGDGFVQLRGRDGSLSLSLEDARSVAGVKAKRNAVMFKDALADVDVEYVVLPEASRSRSC